MLQHSSPAWSPDGKKIAFVSIRAGVSQIFVMNAGGTNVRQLTNGNAENIHPTWAPDSERILFNTTKFAGGVLRHQNVTGVTAIHDALGDVDPGAGNVRLLV